MYGKCSLWILSILQHFKHSIKMLLASDLLRSHWKSKQSDELTCFHEMLVANQNHFETSDESACFLVANACLKNIICMRFHLWMHKVLHVIWLKHEVHLKRIVQMFQQIPLRIYLSNLQLSSSCFFNGDKKCEILFSLHFVDKVKCKAFFWMRACLLISSSQSMFSDSNLLFLNSFSRAIQRNRWQDFIRFTNNMQLHCKFCAVKSIPLHKKYRQTLKSLWHKRIAIRTNSFNVQQT